MRVVVGGMVCDCVLCRLRSGKLSCNARDVLASVVTSCDKRRARLQGETGPDTKTEAQPGSATENPTAENGEKKVVRIKKYNKSRSDEVLGQLHTQLRHVQNYLDPDATESSSGGESGDEMDKAQAGAELYAPLQERAKYRWYLRRAQLASQWVWLQAQVSDLEYKIRQHTELYRSQRLGKGSVQLGEEVVSWPPHSKLAVSSSPDTVPLSCPVPNKVYGSSNDSEASSEDESSRTCCRVRPVKRVRRRKLVDTYGLHHTVARAAKLSTVSCQCLRPEQWCVLCLGRRSHSLSVSTDKRARAENVALLDHSYHTVLSDPSTHTQLNLVLMENLTNRRWLVRQPTGAPVQPGQPLHLSRVININDREKDKKMKNKDKPDLDLKRKYIKRKDRDGRIVKRRRKLDSERDSRPDSPLDMVSGSVVGDLNIKAVRDGVERIRDKITQKKRKSSYDIDHIVIPMSMAASTRVEKLKYKEIITPSWREVNNPEEEKELVSLPVSQEQEKDSQVEVKEEVKDEVKEEVDEKITNTVKGTEETDKNTDVITNDVTDEVNGKDKSEKKDAVTVKDEVEEDMEVEDDFEDISDLAYKLRHCKAEEEERVRWATPLGRVHGGQRGHHGRGRARRLDSCRTEASSGANTPNPLSPEAIEDIVVATRPSSPQPESSDTSAQTTPLIEAVTSPQPPPQVGEMSSPPPGLLPPTPISSVPASVRGRRRTSSQTKSRDRNLSEASQHSQESSRWVQYRVRNQNLQHLPQVHQSLD